MPASIRGRLDLMPEEYLRQFCGSPALALCCVHADADNTAVHAACTPCHVVCVRSHRGCDRCAVACCPHGRRGCCRCAAHTPPGAFACAAPAAQPVAVSAATSVATATTGHPVVQVAPSQPLFTPALPFGEPQWPLTAPEPVFQLLPGSALPVGPVAVLPPLLAGPAPLSAPVLMEQDEEDLLLEEEVTSTRL